MQIRERVSVMSSSVPAVVEYQNFLTIRISAVAVRYGRIPKKHKEVGEQKVTSTEGSSSARSNHEESKQLAIYDIILTISQAHHTHCMTTEDKINVMKKQSYSLVGRFAGEENRSIFKYISIIKDIVTTNQLKWIILEIMSLPSIISTSNHYRVETLNMP